MRETKYLEPTKIKVIGERYSNYPGPYAIDEPDLNKIFPGIKDIKTDPYNEGHFEYVKGDMDVPNLKLITRIVKYLKPKIILEIGTFRGRTTYHLANYSDAQVFTIDIADLGTKVYSGTDLKYHQDKKDVGRTYKKTTFENRITQIISDSLSQECLEKLDALLLGRKIDFALIDAGHDYDSVRHNFEELVLPRLADDGVVVFDDYNRPLSIVGVSHYLIDKSFESGYVFYWYAPRNGEWTNEVVFLNKPEARCYNWRDR